MLNISTPPRISVITATKNVVNTLPALYSSLRRQNYSNFEWLVIDGLSSDATVELLRSYAASEPWIRFVSEADFGLYHAINKGITLCTGDYYVVAGADDAFADSALTSYAEYAAGGADLVLASVIRNGKIIGGFHPNKSWIGHAKVFHTSHSVGMLFKKDLHERFGLYSKRFPLLADGYFLKLLLKSDAVNIVLAPFVAGMFADSGLSSVNKLQILAETWQIQMLTERSALFQTLLFAGKVLVRFPAVLEELRSQRALTKHFRA